MTPGDRRQEILINDTDILLKLLEVLDLIFKKKKRGAGIQDGYYLNNLHLKKTALPGKSLVGSIYDCLLTHRFNEATKLLWIICQDRYCFELFLYKGIMVALDNLISSDELETVKNVTREFMKLRHVNKPELQLEYLIYALKKDLNSTEDSYYLESKIPSKKHFRIIPWIEMLYSAYSALISYITWTNISQSEKLSETNKEFAFTIIVSFKQLIFNPGIWDIFVLKLIEMLEFYEQYDELEKVLKKYVELNPDHLNAYVYLCVHLHKHNGDTELFIQNAKILSNLCPSDERILLLVQKWDELGKNLKKCVKILFAFLDYPVNGCKFLGWQLLCLHLNKVMSSNKSTLKEHVVSSWNKRSSSWSYIHFNLSNIDTDAFKLIQWKVKVLSIMQSDHEYIQYVKKKYPNVNELLLQNRDSSLTSEDFASLYKLNDNTNYG